MTDKVGGRACRPWRGEAIQAGGSSSFIRNTANGAHTHGMAWPRWRLGADLVDTVCSVLLDLADPVPNVVEALFIRHIIYQENTHRSAVVGSCDGPKALLPRSVPDLKLEALSLLLNGANLEVDSNGGDERGSEGIVRKAK